MTPEESVQRIIDLKGKIHDANHNGTFDSGFFHYLHGPHFDGVRCRIRARESGLMYARVWSKIFSQFTGPQLFTRHWWKIE